MLSVLQLDCRLHPRALTKLARESALRGVSALALPPAAALLLPQYPWLFAADGRLLSLALWQELLQLPPHAPSELIIGVDISDPGGYLLARLAATALPHLALLGSDAAERAALSRRIYWESGLVIRHETPELILLPPAAQPVTVDSCNQAQRRIPLPVIHSEAGALSTSLAEALLRTAMDQQPADILNLAKKLRRMAYRCNYYPQ
ncbi:MAG: hypothetical protein RRY35_02650 [Clostridiales bacterium]